MMNFFSKIDKWLIHGKIHIYVTYMDLIRSVAVLMHYYIEDSMENY